MRRASPTVSTSQGMRSKPPDLCRVNTNLSMNLKNRLLTQLCSTRVKTRVKLVSNSYLCLTHQFGNWFPPDPTELGPDPCCLLKLRFANSRTLCCCFELTLNSTQTPFVVSLSSINSCKFQLNPMSGFLDWLILV